MTAADFTPVTPEAAAAALDAALFDDAPADERLLDAWATIVAMGAQVDGLKYLIAAIAQDWGDKCCDGPDDCACTMGQAIRLARSIGVTN